MKVTTATGWAELVADGEQVGVKGQMAILDDEQGTILVLSGLSAEQPQLRITGARLVSGQRWRWTNDAGDQLIVEGEEVANSGL